jgi:indole-3-glycerol phosphate synthase
MILDKIIAQKRQHDVPPLPAVDMAVLADLPACRGFRRALQRPVEAPIHVIAESKKGSPSKGIFNEHYDPVAQGYFYHAGGAHCLSVLTDEQFFFGSLGDLIKVRAAVDLPIIRKDFIIDPRQIAQARLVGADCVLLIMACLEDGLARDLYGFAQEIGLDVLVEVHDFSEAARAVQLEADMIGVNNRNLNDFSVSLETTFDLLPGLVAQDRVVVSESGITDRQQCMRLEAAGVDAILVGETLMRAQDPANALRQLRGQLAV